MEAQTARLEAQEINPEELAEQIMDNPDLLQDILPGIFSEKARVKFPIAKILRTISEKEPGLLYPRFDFFIDLLDSDNNIIKWNAMDIIANLTAADEDNKFDRIFERYFSLLNDGSLITAGHVVDNSAKIAAAKPERREQIEALVLTVEEVPLPTSECRNILAGKAILAFDQWFDVVEDKEAVVGFVHRQLNSSRNATKNKAAKFLKRRHITS